MDWRAKVELFEEIRREYEFGVGTLKGVARKFGLHRRIVRQAVANALPPRRKRPERKCPKLGPVVAFVDAILESDGKAPRKQRHTAHRIYERLGQELPGRQICESTVRRYVQRWGSRLKWICTAGSNDSESGTLSRCFGTKARGPRRIDAPRAMATARALAAKL